MLHATTWMNLENVMLNERSQIQKATYRMIPFILSGIGKSLETKKEISDCQGSGRKELGLTANTFGVSFRGDVNALKLDSGDGCTT